MLVASMSVLGHKRKWRHVRVMSALPPKMDIDRHEWQVRFVPKASIPPFIQVADVPRADYAVGRPDSEADEALHH